MWIKGTAKNITTGRTIRRQALVNPSIDAKSREIMSAATPFRPVLVGRRPTGPAVDRAPSVETTTHRRVL
jgi:hypothetical protein